MNKVIIDKFEIFVVVLNVGNVVLMKWKKEVIDRVVMKVVVR